MRPKKTLVLSLLFLGTCVVDSNPLDGSLQHLIERRRAPLLEADFLMAEKLVAANCTPSSINDFPPDLFTQEERMSGAIAIHVVVILYMCGVMGIVCDRYFVPSLEIISDYCGLPSDVAGATFMAMGTSAPELFSSVIGSFITEGDIGVGTIVGSAVFNILGVTALIGLAVGRESLKIDWFPISRDCIAYVLTVVLLIVVISDSFVTWYEACILLLFYALYVTAMIFNSKIERFSHLTVQRFTASNGEKRPLIDKQPSVSDADDDDLPEAIFEVPKGGFFAVALWLIFLPANIVLACTIPDLSGRRKFLFPLTFILSIIWIGLSSYVTVWMVTVAGYTLGIPDSIMGLTVLAAGTSVPEVFSSVLVARRGKGNMALCNLLGSNIFDILFCLGAPWLVKTAYSARNVWIQSPALTYTGITLLMTVVMLFLTLIVMRWKVNYKTGIICTFLYGGFLTMAVLYEFLMFGISNPC
ncbi:sodium/potassium/calcium exchanger 4 [Galendromus occidentalis]|uniref:Sodium/potassium/calcium exchanger 4 n=1 Tax=Galendromus occidentalis TaxID=34638 RepID=A0AAJ6QLP7_9ACAR|nr:sodium/potassium/calcium exchanger 4 [Galendromus occidentalis]